MQEWAGYVPQAEWLSVGDLVARDCEPSYDTPERRGLIGHRLVVGLQPLKLCTGVQITLPEPFRDSSIGRTQDFES